MDRDRALRAVIVVACIIALVALVAGGVWLWKGSYDRAVITSYVDKGNAKAEADMGQANVVEAAEAEVDAGIVAEQRKELKDAMDAPPSDDGLTDRQRRGCIILRQQGQDLARIPTCRALAPHR